MPARRRTLFPAYDRGRAALGGPLTAVPDGPPRQRPSSGRNRPSAGPALDRAVGIFSGVRSISLGYVERGRCRMGQWYGMGSANENGCTRPEPWEQEDYVCLLNG